MDRSALWVTVRILSVRTHSMRFNALTTHGTPVRNAASLEVLQWAPYPWVATVTQGPTVGIEGVRIHVGASAHTACRG